MNQVLLKGTRLALVGAIWYLFEWAFILPFGPMPPAADSTTRELVSYFAGIANSMPIYAVGVSAAILGRLLFIAALRRALDGFEEYRAVLDFAFACCIVAVTFETVSYALEAVTVSMAGFGPEPPVAAAAALEAGKFVIANFLNIPHGLFLAAAAFVMLKTRAFPGWVSWVGLLGGIGFILSTELGPQFESFSAVQGPVEFFSFILSVVWMLSTGVVLFARSRPVVQGQPSTSA